MEHESERKVGYELAASSQNSLTGGSGSSDEFQTVARGDLCLEVAASSSQYSLCQAAPVGIQKFLEMSSKKCCEQTGGYL